MKNRRIRRASVIAVVQPQPRKVADDGFGERRMPDTVELGVYQVRHLGLAASQLDQRQAFDGSSELAAAPLVDAQQRRQARERGVVHVQRAGEDLSDRGLGARPVDGILVAGGVQQAVRLRAGGLVRAEERADVASQRRPVVGRTSVACRRPRGPGTRAGRRGVRDERSPTGRGP